MPGLLQLAPKTWLLEVSSQLAQMQRIEKLVLVDQIFLKKCTFFDIGGPPIPENHPEMLKNYFLNGIN
jgi:hypothetical protein